VQSNDTTERTVNKEDSQLESKPETLSEDTVVTEGLHNADASVYTESLGSEASIRTDGTILTQDECVSGCQTLRRQTISAISASSQSVATHVPPSWLGCSTDTRVGGAETSEQERQGASLDAPYTEAAPSATAGTRSALPGSTFEHLFQGH